MSTRCSAYTLSGKRCKKNASVNNHCCYLHCKKRYTLDDVKQRIISVCYNDNIQIKDIMSLLIDINCYKVIDSFDLNKELLTLKATHPETKNCKLSFSSIFKHLSDSFNRWDNTKGCLLEKVAFLNTRNDYVIVYIIHLIHRNRVPYIRFLNDLISKINALRGCLDNKQEAINKWHEKNLNNLRVKLLCKMPELSDDVCKYVISQYL